MLLLCRGRRPSASMRGRVTGAAVLPVQQLPYLVMACYTNLVIATNRDHPGVSWSLPTGHHARQPRFVQSLASHQLLTSRPERQLQCPQRLIFWVPQRLITSVGVTALREAPQECNMSA